MRQVDLVLMHLQTKGSITPREADDLYGITRLGARIWDLKQDGHRIIAEREEGVNRMGDKCHWAKYRLVKGETA